MQTFHVVHDVVLLEKDSILSHPPSHNLPPTIHSGWFILMMENQALGGMQLELY